MSSMENLRQLLLVLLGSSPMTLGLLVVAHFCKKRTEPGNCQLLVRGVISGVKVVRIKRGSNYLPVYQYEYMGVLYEKTGTAPMMVANRSEAQKKIGTEIEIYIDPADPEKYFYSGDVKMYRIMRIIFLCGGWGLILLITGLFLFF